LKPPVLVSVPVVDDGIPKVKPPGPRDAPPGAVPPPPKGPNAKVVPLVEEGLNAAGTSAGLE